VMDPEEDRYQWLRQAHHQASRDFDKAVMTLSAGALGVSIAFVNNVAPHSTETIWLGAAWVAFAMSLLLILGSFLASQHALLYEMRLPTDASASRRIGGVWGTATAVLNWTSAIALVKGVVALIIFALYNI
jgi:hypothetical protein